MNSGMARDDGPELRTAVTGDAVVTVPKANKWELYPFFCLTSALGILSVVIGYNAARVSFPWADLLFWLGLAAMFLPIAIWLLCSLSLTRYERTGLLAVLVTALYLVKVLKSPFAYGNYDEYLFWRSAQDVALSHHLFQPNPLLAITPWYPGLEIVTNAVSSLTGLDVFTSSLIIIGVARVLLIVSLYLLFERVFDGHISDASRAAGIATLLYMTNPHFVFFDANASYESLALPLGVFVLYAVASRLQKRDGHRIGLTVVIWLAVAAVVITHHVTSYVLAAFLLLWAVASVWRTHRLWIRSGPAGPALLTLALSASWLVYTGDLAANYVGSILDTAVRQLFLVLSGEVASRQLFHDSAGSVASVWERGVTEAAVALTLLGLLWGLPHIWRYHRESPAALAFAGAALIYPFSQAFRLGAIGGGVADRATEFVFVGIAFVLAARVTRLFSPVRSRGYPAIMVSAVLIMFIGGTVLGAGLSWNRLPGPYLVSADARSIGPEGIAAAQWANAYLGSGQRFATDRDNALLMATYGRQWVVTGAGGNVQTAPVFTSLQVDPEVRAIIQRGRIHYLLVDRRLSTGLPRFGVYFDDGEPNAFHYSRPIDARALAKFDEISGVSRIFDSGNIVMYDVGVLDSGS